MNKTIYLVYQDCPLCGARRGWGEEQAKIADDAKIPVVKIPFTHASEQINAKGVIMRAAMAGVKLPFFTDGEKFSQTIADFIEEEATTTTKATKSRKKKNGTTTTTE